MYCIVNVQKDWLENLHKPVGLDTSWMHVRFHVKVIDAFPDGNCYARETYNK